MRKSSDFGDAKSSLSEWEFTTCSIHGRFSLMINWHFSKWKSPLRFLLQQMVSFRENIKNEIACFCNLAGLVSYEKPVTPRSRGNSYCIGCDSATNGQFPWQGTAQSMFKRFNNPGNSSSLRLSGSTWALVKYLSRLEHLISVVVLSYLKLKSLQLPIVTKAVLTFVQEVLIIKTVVSMLLVLNF